jgi:hypothetical protein
MNVWLALLARSTSDPQQGAHPLSFSQLQLRTQKRDHHAYSTKHYLHEAGFNNRKAIVAARLARHPAFTAWQSSLPERRTVFPALRVQYWTCLQPRLAQALAFWGSILMARLKFRCYSKKQKVFHRLASWLVLGQNNERVLVGFGAGCSNWHAGPVSREYRVNVSRNGG